MVRKRMSGAATLLAPGPLSEAAGFHSVDTASTDIPTVTPGTITSEHICSLKINQAKGAQKPYVDVQISDCPFGPPQTVAATFSHTKVVAHSMKAFGAIGTMERARDSGKSIHIAWCTSGGTGQSDSRMYISHPVTYKTGEYQGTTRRHRAKELV